MPKANTKEKLPLIRKVDLPEGQSGNWRVVKLTVSKADADFAAMRAMAGSSMGRGIVREGEVITQLLRGNTVVMSDTMDEIRDHWGVAHAARGRVLIAGLGLGVVVQACCEKDSVEHVTVIDKSPDVIKLTGGIYQERYGDKLTIVEADIFEWKPPKGDEYGAVWFDIFDTICADNLPQMTKLKRKFGRVASWQGCWAEAECRRQARHWQRILRY